MSEIKEWFLSMPPITRAWFGLSVAFPLIGRLGILNAYYMILTSDFITKLHLWRPLSATFYYPLTPGTGFHYLINLYFLYNYSKNLETNEFTGRPADYLFMLMFNWAALLMGIFMNLYLLMDPLILSVLYVWCNLNPELIVSFWFGTRFKARYLPWVLCGFNLLLGSGGFNEILGIIVGHLYFYVKYKYPQDNGGAQLINTPNFLYGYLPSFTPMRSTGSTLNSFQTASSVRNRRNPGPDPAPASSGGYNWGRGQVLGGR
ncbi:Derlin 1 [Tyrophagus putrescentiae]|nr:Derlin 1 [Tyrophagus putrescentiae]